MDRIPVEAATASPAPTPVAQWRVTRTISKIDDTENVVAEMSGDYPVYDKFSRAKTVTILVACRESTTDFIVHFDDLFMADSGGFGEVIVRLDKAKARKIQMTESTDHQALGLWGGSGIPLIKSMIGKKKMLIVATPFSESSVETTISLDGFDSAVMAVRKACNW